MMTSPSHIQLSVLARRDRHGTAAVRDDPTEGASDVSSNEETVEYPNCGERLRPTLEQAERTDRQLPEVRSGSTHSVKGTESDSVLKNSSHNPVTHLACNPVSVPSTQR